MTLPASTRTAGPFLGNGATTSFPFTFKVFAATDLQVVTLTASVETTRVLNSDYSVTLNADQETTPGGTVLYPISGTPLAVGSMLTIGGNRAATQPLDLTLGGNFNPTAIENTFDHVVILIQQIAERLGRAVTVSLSATGTTLTVPPPVAGNLLGWNASATALENVDPDTLVEVAAFGARIYDRFTMDGIASTVTLTNAPGLLANCDIYMDGVALEPEVDYTLSGTTVTFPSAPAAGRRVLARHGVAIANSVADALNVNFLQAGSGAVPRDVRTKLREVHVSVKDFGAVGDGVTNDTAAFTLAAATGRRVHLLPGDTYLLSARISLLTGGGFVCPTGYATVVFKTGGGAFDSTDLTASKDATNRCGFLADTVDDVELSGIRFETDGANPVVVYPVRVRGGMAGKGVHLNRLHFEGFPICNGGFVSLNTIGAGSYDVRDISARACGTSSTAWTGTPQITVVEVDNDMVASVPSEHGYIENIRGVDIAFTGAALTAYGQQTDVLNIAGISGTDRKGPTIVGVYGDNVGEIVDLFCSHAIVKGVRGRDIYNFGVKLVHGARWNDIELETIENFGSAAVGFAGSASLAVHTQYNTVRVGTIRVNADVAGLATVAAVKFQDNGGSGASCLPKNNICRIGAVIGNGVDLDYVVSDGGADNDNANFVEVTYATGWVTGFVFAPPDNVTARYRQNPRSLMTVGVAQTLTTNVWTVIQTDTLGADTDGGADTAGFKVRPRFPGPKLVRGSIRVSGINAGDDVELRLLKNGVVVAQSATEPQSGGLAYGYDISKVVYVAENESGLAAGDLTFEARVVSAGVISVNAVSTMSYFEVTDLG